MAKIKLDKKAVEAIKPQPGKLLIVWDTEEKGFGVRVSAGGTRTFFAQGYVKGKATKTTIGKFGDITAQQARIKARDVLRDMRSGIDHKPKRVQPEKTATLGDLLLAYVGDLESRGRVSAKAVGNALDKHVKGAHLKLWSKPANAIDIDDCMVIIKTLTNSGRLREADKVRSYLKAAYTVAINARSDASASTALLKMKIKFNPARDIVKVRGSGNAKERVLSLSEFRAYWQRIQTLAEPQRSLLMLHVLTGGQRQQQLARVTWSDYDGDTQTIAISDTKGKRIKARRHIVPILPQCLTLMRGVTGAGDFIFSADGGQSPINPSYLSAWVKKVCIDMGDAGELQGDPFTAGAVRATIETRLMKKPYRVSSDVIGQLLSHGTGGVQQRHYQHDDFADEKLEALEMLRRMVEDEAEPSTKVAQFIQDDRGINTEPA